MTMKDQKIIIKKVKKVSGGGHHGGSWKVAYADFVTAMMAFFLLLWLITMVSPEKRARVSAYFRTFSIFTTSGTSMFLDRSSAIFSESGPTMEKAVAELYGPAGSITASQLEEIIKKTVESRLKNIQDQIIVSVVDEGVRIEMIDKSGSSMFTSGSAELTARARNILRVLAESIKGIENEIFIEGHTDSQSYTGKKYFSNWELSAARANAARRQLEHFGIRPERIGRVVGYADRVPLIEENPLDPRNRRISIILSFPDEDYSLPSINIE